MEMEGSGGSQGQLIHLAVDVDEAALAVTKRARKRSRYLSPPYTDTGVQEKTAAGSHKQREEEEGPPHVSAAEVLSTLRATALGQGEGMDAAALRFLAMYSRNRNRNGIFVDDHADSHAAAGEEGLPHVSAAEVLSALRATALGQGERMEAAAVRFLAMYSRNRNRNGIFVDEHPDSHAAAGRGGGGGGGSQDNGGNKPPSVSAAGVGRQMLNLNAGPDDGSLAKKKNPHPPAAVAAGANAKQQKDDSSMENAAVVEHAIATLGHAPQLPGFAATATHGHPSEKKKRNKKRLKTVGQHNYVGNPVALVLNFAEGTPLPSREDLFSAFSRFGVVIDLETAISQDKHTARVAFATRAQAEAALSCAATLGGTFGPPFAVASLQDLPPITLNMPPPPLPKLPLTDIRNNLGKMILSLSSKATAAPQEANGKTAVDSLSLVGEMQHLLAKVDKALQVQRASATAHHA